jgi:hypothetical protein
MASEGQGPGESPSSGYSVVDSIRKIAAKNARADLGDEDQLLLFLQSWWSRLYNRPLLDPLLQTYTIEQLLYEFFDRVERHAAEKERAERVEVMHEEDKENAVLDWAEREEKRELEQMKAKAAEIKKVVDPAKDPDNIKWMEEQMKVYKDQFGEDFGKDIVEDFE